MMSCCSLDPAACMPKKSQRACTQQSLVCQEVGSAEAGTKQIAGPDLDGVLDLLLQLVGDVVAVGDVPDAGQGRALRVLLREAGQLGVHLPGCHQLERVRALVPCTHAQQALCQSMKQIGSLDEVLYVYCFVKLGSFVCTFLAATSLMTSAFVACTHVMSALPKAE